MDDDSCYSTKALMDLINPQDTKRGRHRPCKATRNQCKQLLSQMNDLYKDDPEQNLGVLNKVWETSVDGCWWTSVVGGTLWWHNFGGFLRLRDEG